MDLPHLDPRYLALSHGLLEKAHSSRQAPRTEHSEAPNRPGAQIRDDVAEHVFGHDDVIKVGFAQHMNRDCVRVRVVKLYIWKVRTDFGGDCPKERVALQDIRLVANGQAALAVPRC